MGKTKNDNNTSELNSSDDSRIVSIYLYKDLKKEIDKMFNRIIITQNKELIRQIAKDFNINEKVMLIKYKNGAY